MRSLLTKKEEYLTVGRRHSILAVFNVNLGKRGSDIGFLPITVALLLIFQNGCSKSDKNDSSNEPSPTIAGTWDGECLKADLLMGDYHRNSYVFEGARVMLAQHEWTSECTSQAIGAIRLIGTFTATDDNLTIVFSKAYITPVGATISDIEPFCPGLTFKFGEKTDVSTCGPYAEMLTNQSKIPYQKKSDTLTLDKTLYNKSKFDEIIPN